MQDNATLKRNHALGILFALVVLLIITNTVQTMAIPTGPTITFITNETKQPSNAAIINTSGGSISTVYLNTTTQNVRWKAYVGNVTGTLTLDDVNDNTLFDWTLTDVNGEIYATRFSGTINWSSVNCSNSTHMEIENIALNQTNKDDNISATFNGQPTAHFMSAFDKFSQTPATPSTHT